MDTMDTVQFVWWQGVVEDRNDPLQLGRCRVRILGFHPQEREAVKINELPWAFPLQDITSAAISGIGHAPVGPLEGTWVIGFFRDGENAQEPIMLGTIGGIPQNEPCLSGLGFFDPNGIYPLVGSSPVQDAIAQAGAVQGLGIEELSTAFGVDFGAVSKAKDIVSGVQGQIETVQNLTDGVQSQVEAAVGNAITAATGVTATSDQIQAASASVLANVEGQIGTQAAVVLAGVDSQLQAIEGLVAGAQADIEAAALSAISGIEGVIPAGAKAAIEGAVGNVLSQLAIIGKGIERASDTVRDALKDAQTKALESASKSISSVLDGLPGENAVSSLDAIAAGAIEFNGLSFSTPGIGEPDTSRLARTDGQVIFGRTSEEHPVVSQKTNVLNIPGFNGVPIESEAANPNAPLNKDLRQIATANSFVKWFEPPTDAVFTEYPFNHVFESESGHIQEFDDTPGHERIHTFHKTGTFEEIHPDGSRVLKVVGTNYEIIHKDNNLLVKGDLNITVDKQARIKIQNTFDIEVDDGTMQVVIRKGNLNIQVEKGNANVFVAGNLTTSVGGNRTDKVLGNHTIEVGGIFKVQAGQVTIKAGTIFLN